MSKTTLSPLASLAPQIPSDPSEVAASIRATLEGGFRELLLEEKCCPNGTAYHKIRDPDWTKDIANLVSRVEHHRIVTQTDSGLWESETVSVNLATLRCEVDDNGEICCWIYEEGST